MKRLKSSRCLEQSDSGSTTAGAASLGLDLGEVEEDALSEINERLRKCPKKILPTLHFIRRGQLSDRRKEEAPTARVFPSSYIRLAHIPNDLICEMLADVWDELPPGTAKPADVAQLELVEKFCKGTLKEIMYVGACVEAGTKWPRTPKDARSIKYILKKMHSDVSVKPWNSLKVVEMARGVMMIDWTSWGYYTLLPPEGAIKTAVRHVSGVTVTLSSITFDLNDATHRLEANNSEKDAVLILGPLRLNIKTQLFRDLAEKFPSARANERFAYMCSNYQQLMIDDGIAVPDVGALQSQKPMASKEPLFDRLQAGHRLVNVSPSSASRASTESTMVTGAAAPPPPEIPGPTWQPIDLLQSLNACVHEDAARALAEAGDSQDLGGCEKTSEQQPALEAPAPPPSDASLPPSQM